MAGGLGDLNISLSANIANFATAFDRAAYLAKQSMDRTAAAVNSATRSLDGIEKQAKVAADAVQGFNRLATLGVSAYAGFELFKSKILGTVDAMGRLKDLSEQTGTSVEQLSRLGFAAKLGGSDIESVNAALVKLSKGMAGADEETKGAGKALAYLGISAKDANGNMKSAGSLYEEVAIALNKYENGVGKTNIALTLFGKGGASQLNVMRELVENGQISAKVTTEQAEASDKFHKSMVKADAAMQTGFKTFVKEITPAMQAIGDSLADNAEGFAKIGKQAGAAVAGLINHADAVEAAVKAYIGLKATNFAASFAPNIASAASGTLALANSVKALAVGSAAATLAEKQEAAASAQVAAAKLAVINAQKAENAEKVAALTIKRQTQIATLAEAAADVEKVAASKALLLTDNQLGRAKQALAASEAASAAASAGHTRALAAQNVALNGTTLASRTAAAANGVLGASFAALAANPIGAVITALGLAVTAYMTWKSVTGEGADPVGKLEASMKRAADQKNGYYKTEYNNNLDAIAELEKQKSNAILEVQKASNTSFYNEIGQRDMEATEQAVRLAKSNVDQLTKKLGEAAKHQKWLLKMSAEENKNKGQIDFSSSGNKYKADPWIEAYNNLGKDTAALQFQIDSWDQFKGKVSESQRAVVEFEIQYGKFSDAKRIAEGFNPLTGSQINALLAQADAYIAKKREIEKLAFSSDTDKQYADQAAILVKKQQELDIIGKTQFEAAQINNVLAERERVQERINEATRKGLNLSAGEQKTLFEGADAYAAKLNQIEQMRRRMSRDPFVGAASALKNYADEATDLGKNIGDSLASAFKRSEDALASFITSGKANFSDLANSIVSDLSRIAIQRAVTGPIADFMGTALNGFASWLVGSFSVTPGESSNPAYMGPAKPGGYSTGGYTGDGGKFDPAGIVHRGEYVFSQDATKRIGLGTLERLHKGYASGGYVGDRSPSIYVPSEAAVQSGLSGKKDGGNVIVNVVNQSGSEAKTRQSTDAMGNKTIDVLITDTVNKGIVSGAFNKSMHSAFNLRRATS